MGTLGIAQCYVMAAKYMHTILVLVGTESFLYTKE